MRLPSPAAMIIAVHGTSAGTSARRRSARFAWLMRRASTARGGAGCDVGVEPLAQRRKVWLFEVALQQAPHARLETAVARLVVALPQSRENSEDPRIALGRKRPISTLEHLSVAGRGDIMVDH